MNIFDNKDTDLLIKAICKTTDSSECKSLLEDLMTIKEIQDMAQRLTVAKMLREKKSYGEISETTGASTATISRVNRCLTYGNGGYNNILNKINED